MNQAPKRLSLSVTIEPWNMAQPFVISGYTFQELELLHVSLSDGVSTGRGEAAGVYYLADTPEAMVQQIEDNRSSIERGITRKELLSLLPAGGARNALDCALWDLESRQRQRSVESLAGLSRPQPLVTTMTLGAGSPQTMAADASSRFATAPRLKLKLLNDGQDVERVAAVRAARGDAWIAVDGNQGFTRPTLLDALPHFVAAGVALIEQPFKVGEEALLDDLASPIPIAADESVQSLTDLPGLVGRVQAVNIKLDKCGGLTEALLMVRSARSLGFQVMVGSMPATSLAIAPAFLVGQLCDIVDLDAPLFLSRAREPAIAYTGGTMTVPSGLWGWPG
jgi:L-alanine-DL-glutamate epimerase-like enolase superfamily enzyme